MLADAESDDDADSLNTTDPNMFLNNGIGEEYDDEISDQEARD